MITLIKILPAIPWTQEDYLIARSRMSLLTRLNYLRDDARDSALMFALTDATHEARNAALKERIQTPSA